MNKLVLFVGLVAATVAAAHPALRFKAAHKPAHKPVPTPEGGWNVNSKGFQALTVDQKAKGETKMKYVSCTQFDPPDRLFNEEHMKKVCLQAGTRCSWCPHNIVMSRCRRNPLSDACNGGTGLNKHYKVVTLHNALDSNAEQCEAGDGDWGKVLALLFMCCCCGGRWKKGGEDG